jgi:hypothetical protein
MKKQKRITRWLITQVSPPQNCASYGEGFIDIILRQLSAWIVAHAFCPEAISIASCPVAQYLGLKLGLQIDHSIVPPIPNI